MSRFRALLLVAPAILAALSLAACDNGTDVSLTVPKGAITPQATPTTPSKSTGGTTGGPDVVTKGYASQYAPSIDELPGQNKVNAPETFIGNLGTFTSSYLFTSNTVGEQKANEWKIVDIFQVAYDPTGLQADLLRGRYYVRAEVYMTYDVESAKAMYTYMNDFFKGRPGSEVIQTKQLGNQSSAFKAISGKVGTSDEDTAYYRMVVRRGNIVYSVMVVGSNQRISVDEARELAIIVDDKILGKTPSVVPTPVPTPSFGGR